MSFMYPRTVAVWRPNKTTPTQVGDVGYSAERGASDETLVVSGLSASIQFDRQGQHNPVGLPTDATYKPVWKVFIPKSAAALGSILANDVVIDDLGIRYQVFSPYWNSLGYRLGCIVLEP